MWTEYVLLQICNVLLYTCIIYIVYMQGQYQLRRESLHITRDTFKQVDGSLLPRFRFLS